MSLITYDFDLLITPIDYPPVLNISQYDNSRTYVAHLKNDNGTPFSLESGSTATFEGTNARGVTFQIEAAVSDDTVTFVPSEAATEQYGKIIASICIKSGGEQLTPLNVVLDVQRAGATREDIERSPGFTDVIDEAVENYLEDHPVVVQVNSVNAKTGDVVLNASDVNALPSNAPVYTPTNQPPYPVRSVNGQTGDVVIQTGGGGGGDGAVSSVNGKVGTVVLTASDVGALPSTAVIPSRTSDLTNDSGFITAAQIPSAAVESVNGKTGNVTLKTSDLTNDSGFITLSEIPTAPVQSVNGKTGVVTLKTSDITNDKGYVNAQQAADSAPVQSVNGKTGSVMLDASDVGALADDAPVLTYSSQTLTEAQKTQARANIGAIGNNVLADVVYDIYAELRTDSEGNYYKFTGGINASTIVSALNSGMLPIVRRNDNQYKHKWYFSEYNDDGEDVYIQFFRVVRSGVEVMRYVESEGKAYITTYTLTA